MVPKIAHESDVAPDRVVRRLVYALALVPIVPAISVVGVTVVDPPFGLGAFDEIRWFNFLFAALWTTATICIWRSVILWTLGRKWLTVLVCLIPFVQVAFAQPLWASGCFGGDILRIGQHELGIGLFVWLSVWIWWGWEKRRMAEETTESYFGVRSMTPTAKRLAASIGTIPFLFGCFLITTIGLEDLSIGAPFGLVGAYVLTAVVAIITWVLIWRRVVAWSATVIRRTILATAAMIVAPVALTMTQPSGPAGLLAVIVWMLPVIGWGGWMAWTISIWPKRAGPSMSGSTPPRCLKCGYLLIGLRATRCPECGDEPTLDELWHASMQAGP